MYKSIPDLKTIVPPLLGLKGNLEMTIASRISTLVRPATRPARPALPFALPTTCT